jgi:hypothetical protein
MYENHPDGFPQPTVQLLNVRSKYLSSFIRWRHIALPTIVGGLFLIVVTQISNVNPPFNHKSFTKTSFTQTSFTKTSLGKGSIITIGSPAILLLDSSMLPQAPYAHSVSSGLILHQSYDASVAMLYIHWVSCLVIHTSFVIQS